MSILTRLFRRTPAPWDPLAVFQSPHYRRHNQKRQEHLASLGLPLHQRTVLEVGAGIGDHTYFFLERGCQVVSTEARPENLQVLRRRHPSLRVEQLNLDPPPAVSPGTFDIVYCYGMLYHLGDPAAALGFLARCTGDLLLLETRVTFGTDALVHPCPEDARIPSHSVQGRGCRPTRPWIHQHLRSLFSFVYMPVTQPNHEEFPLDWTTPPTDQPLTRGIFIASRRPIDNPLLVETLPMQQRRIA